MLSESWSNRLISFCRSTFTPIQPYSLVEKRIRKLTATLQDLLALSLETTLSYANRVYLVDISQAIPLGAEPVSGRIFRLRFFIHQDYIRVQLLILPRYLRGKGYGRKIWEVFYTYWLDLYKEFEVEYKNDDSQTFWTRMGFVVDDTFDMGIDFTGRYTGRKMSYRNKRASALFVLQREPLRSQ